MGADGASLTGDALTAAQAAYDSDAADGTANDGLWYGWTVRASEITIDKAGADHFLLGKAQAFTVKPTPAASPVLP